MPIAIASFISGAIAMGFAICAVFFLRSWARTRDYLFAAFALAFFLLALNQALVTVLVAGADPDKLQRWVAWGFGSFEGVTWARMSLFAPLLLAALIVSAMTTKQLNALLLGENYASSMGLNVRHMRLLTMAGASVLGGVVTAFCGPVAFLGIAIPHMCRGLLGTSDHRSLVPATILMGGIVALVAQIVSLLPSLISNSAGRFPLNAITSLFGAPVVVLVLMRSRKGAFTG